MAAEDPFDGVKLEHGTLSLAYRGVSEVPQAICERYGSLTKRLDLSHNDFSSLAFLSAFPNLTELVVDRNQIGNDVELPSLPHLTLFSANHNDISDVEPLLEQLKSNCPALTYAHAETGSLWRAVHDR
eukprot:m.68051 g.68051  ORF g.68051 m.68051 type:complete len:128 (+) comp12186_c0_seq4:182-565(+)